MVLASADNGYGSVGKGWEGAAREHLSKDCRQHAGSAGQIQVSKNPWSEYAARGKPGIPLGFRTGSLWAAAGQGRPEQPAADGLDQRGASASRRSIWRAGAAERS